LTSGAGGVSYGCSQITPCGVDGYRATAKGVKRERDSKTSRRRRVSGRRPGAAVWGLANRAGGVDRRLVCRSHRLATECGQHR